MSDINATLHALSDQLMMLSDADQQFIVGCQSQLSISQVPLTPAQVARVTSIVKTLRESEYSTMVLGEAPLSVPKMLKNLHSAVHMLTPAEHNLVLKCARQYARHVAISVPDIGQLANIHAAKGF